MPGEENNPNLQPAGTSAGAGENVTPPVAGVQQVGVGVPDPTLQAIGDLQTAYNVKCVSCTNVCRQSPKLKTGYHYEN